MSNYELRLKNLQKWEFVRDRKYMRSNVEGRGGDQPLDWTLGGRNEGRGHFTNMFPQESLITS